MSKALQFLRYVVLLGAFAVSFGSCKEDDGPTTELGSISGTVTGENGQAIPDVTVTISGVKEEDIVLTTDANGKYSVDGVSMKLHAVTFSKTGLLRTSKSVDASDFDEDKRVIVDVMMLDASKMIVGTIIDATNGDAPLEGVTVTVGVAGSATSGSDGKFSIENLIVDNYSVTFSKKNYVDVTKTVAKTDFDAITGVATVDVRMGGKEVLRGLTADDLASAEKWYYNEYRGGRNADAYPHWDWSTDYMGTLDFRGAWEEQNEGTTLQIRNGDAERTNPADLEVFDSFVLGSKKITDDNKIMSLRVRTHSASDAAPTVWGVQVIDLSEAEPVAKKIGDTKGLNSEAYQDFDFDLSTYVGKEVVIVIGTYRAATGDYWKQLVLRAIRFADRKVVGTEWLPGTEVVPGWKLSVETVRSTMPQNKKVFSGLTTYTGDKNRDNYIQAYRSWRDNNHIGANWSFVPLKKDPEVFAGEGYLIKTRGTNEVNTVVPEAYLYAKFSIASGSDQLTLSTRNFSNNPTYFKVTAIQNDGTVTHVDPQFNAAVVNASAAEDGTWKFTHQQGGSGNPDDYAKFAYDLSQFDGQDVTIVIGVYNGVADSGENKLVFHQINLN
ncbi:carboxypeptidase-like regulatory domain-containing protein [Parachryseolinea silvisoli]|uniref:carboxypeptidase-like regulatory domain-containing protein n=1 Tax=Parachryseolinea silvisoli TaxID=2873601 RepID=UPI002265AA8E|nr:carboxypeptidase-like regulatory domain-containing protein [Parachryseolinea silvisoli]MCD9018814.1 carboxypeptidase-like regulatory domain-containing protein [Parachryseolinea silvisoli]